MRNLVWAFVFVLTIAAFPAVVLSECCTAPDNTSGTVDFPADCPYDNDYEPMYIIDGLPPGDTIELWGPLTGFYNVVNSPGGSLGGEICYFEAFFDWTVHGTGSLSGLSRHLYVPMAGEIHIGPRTPGDSVQTFAAQIMDLSGELFGDPDFCMLRVRAGFDYGLPGPGQTTLTRLPSGDFDVDSFFDITYQIEFEGCPDSQLADYMGTTTGTTLKSTCEAQTYTVDWCRLQWPVIIEDWPGSQVTVFGRVYIAGLTDQTTGNDPVPGIVRGQVGYGAPGSDPSAGGWTWTEAQPNPGWDGSAAGEPNNDEYMATLTLPGAGGDYDYAYRFSGDAGTVWLYGDRDTGVPGEDGSEDGYQAANAGKMTVWYVCCSAPDNGSGTVNFPADCPYDNRSEPMYIIEGLPPGDTIELWGPLTDFFNVTDIPGGDLGGEICFFEATLDWTVTGTGSLTGFNRHLSVPVSGEIHIAPRTAGDSIQTFAARIASLSGELFGDPDFCTLRVRAGNDYGLSCPGQTTLTELPSGDFAVDSFFDITYQIEFEGCPASQIQDLMGTTTGTTSKTTCYEVEYEVDWCRLQWPLTVQNYPGTPVTVYGRVYIAGVTDRTTGNDPVPGVVRGQVGYGPPASDPSAAGWTWTEAQPNPGYDGVTAGEPNNDEYMATLTLPGASGNYDYAFRFSGDAGTTWLYGDRDTGVPGEDGSENGYQAANAGKMTVWPVCCTEPDNGTGTIDFPPDCSYDHPTEIMMIVEGLAPGDTIKLKGPLTDFVNVVNAPGGDLGGEICVFDATLDWTVTGSGSLTGFNRHLYVPVTGEIHIGARIRGDSLQAFPVKIVDMSGELFGDPDFCTLRFTSGSANGLPCAGHTVLTELPSGDFAVDSFFDVYYQVEFEGCPASQIEDLMGTTEDIVARTTCFDESTYTADWCRLQWPLAVYEWPDQPVTIYGRLYIAGLTDQTTGNDPVPGMVRGQVGYGPPGTDPSLPSWTWTEALPNPGWDGSAAGEPNNDEYMGTIITPTAGGDYDFACRFSGDAGATWLYGDKKTGVPGEDGSEDGYQSANAGKLKVRDVCCQARDNGSGTVDFPADCPYDNEEEPMYIIDGLPPGDTIELWGPLTGFLNVVNSPGGSLGGEVCYFEAYFDWTVEGTGSLAGFNRHLAVPVSGKLSIAPRTPGDSVQIFVARIDSLQGELFGDPDFCTMRVAAGSEMSLPCPGQATLTELPSGDFAVDSFFDITYRIEFEGCPGSQLADLMGTTTGQTIKRTCSETAGVPEDPAAEVSPTELLLEPNIPNPFRGSTLITYAIPSDEAGARVSLRIYDVGGRVVDDLLDAAQTPGVYQVSWDGTDRVGRRVAPGVYFCRLSVGRESRTRRIVFLR